MNPEFLSLEDVLEIHEMLMERFGGEEGIRDIGLLESALAQPSATFDNDFLHGDLFEMAAAYLFHIVSNHPFLDGNKRTGVMYGLVFLRINGYQIAEDDSTLYEMVIEVAKGDSDKQTISEFLRNYVKE